MNIQGLTSVSIYGVEQRVKHSQLLRTHPDYFIHTKMMFHTHLKYIPRVKNTCSTNIGILLKSVKYDVN